MKHTLEVRDLRIDAGRLSLEVPSLRFEQGQTTCVIGRSGSGKSLLASALSGLRPPGLQIAGNVLLNGQVPADPLWKHHVYLLPQEPAVALNPTMAVGKQVAELFRWRLAPDCPWSTPKVLCLHVGLSAADLEKFPGQLSGGMQQRVMIAMALAVRATFVVADEPTKGLDEFNKAQVIAVFQRIRKMGRGVIVITHDLEVARALADTLVVIDNGRVVEQGAVDRILLQPRSAATRGLVGSEPANWTGRQRGASRAAPPVLSLDNATFRFPRSRPLISDATLAIHRGEIIGLFGSSGAGKSTLADICLGLRQPISGTVRWHGKCMDPAVIRRHRPMFQKLFQNPVTAFPPNLRLADVFDKLTPTRTAGGPSRTTLLSQLDLDEALLDRRPDQVSGGELQRLAIVRVLLAQPGFLVCDEPSSRLDMSVQRLAIDMISDYVDKTSAAVLLISHDLTILRKRADAIFELSENGKLAAMDLNADSPVTDGVLKEFPLAYPVAAEVSFEPGQ